MGLKRYVILCESNADSLAEKAEVKLSEGYKPQGGIGVVTWFEPSLGEQCFGFYQVFIHA